MYQSMIRLIALAGLFGLVGLTAARAQEPGVSLTVYNNDLAVVKERRHLQLDGQRSTIRFTDVAKKIDPTSVFFKSLTDPAGTSVIEQNYEYDLVSADKLLDKYIDKPVAVITEDGSRYTGDLLSFDRGQLVIQGAEQLYMIGRADNVRNVEFSKLPDGLLTRPTLVWQVATNRPGRHLAQVTYQTSGLSWEADYSAVINPEDTQLDIKGWVTINNQSGAAYRDAAVKLIAGDVRKVQQPKQMIRERAMALAARAEADAAGFEQKSFFEYHLYTLGRPTTVNENQIKQIELLAANQVPVTKRYLFEPGGRYWHRRYGDKDEYKVNVFIEFRNDEQSNLGMPLPKGRIRVYKADEADGDLEFVGEDQIDHTPRDEELKLYIGDAFDLVGEKTVTDRKGGQRWRQESIRIALRNHKQDEPVTIRVREHLGRQNWTIEQNSRPFEKVDADTIRFDVPVAPGGESVVEYQVNYRW
jgi:hypothetical protein